MAKASPEKEKMYKEYTQIMICNHLIKSLLVSINLRFEEIFMGLVTEFKEFIYEYKVVPLAIALIMGIASTAFIKSFVDNIVMPVITPFIPGGAWRTATLELGPVVLGWGAFLGELINFVVIAFAVFMIAKMVLKEEKVAKK
jgi:large conductance mechanosensitive channel